MPTPRARSVRPYKRPPEVCFGRAVDAAKKNQEVKAVRLTLYVSQQEAVAISKAANRLESSVAEIVREGVHLWLMHLSRELETAAEGEVERKKAWLQVRGPKAKREKPAS